MATRSSIAIRYGNSIKAVYCHWDGYPEHNGYILQNYYNDSVKTAKLISMGDISSLGADIGEKHEFGIEYQPTYVDNDAGVSIGTECTFYSRDRGEEGVEWQTFTSVEDWISKYEGSGAEYFYLFDAGEWQVSSYRNDKFEPVAEVLAKVFDKEPV